MPGMHVILPATSDTAVPDRVVVDLWSWTRGWAAIVKPIVRAKLIFAFYAVGRMHLRLKNDAIKLTHTFCSLPGWRVWYLTPD